MRNDKLPDGWTRVKFGDVVRNVNENSRNLEADGIDRVVGLDHLDPGSLSLVRWDNITDLPDGTTFTRKFKSGHVLFGKRRAYQRKVAVPDFQGVCSGDILVFEPADKRLLIEFLPCLVQSDGFFDHALGTSAGSLSPRTKWAELAKYEFALPPLGKQQRIVELQRANLAVADSLNRVDGAAEKLFDSVLRSAFSGSESQAEWLTLADVAEIQLGRMLSAERSNGPDLAPYIKNTNVQWDGLDLEELPMMSFPLSERSRYSLRAGDVLVCEGGDAGRSILLEEDLDGVFYQKAVHRVRTTCLDPRYLYFYLVFAYRTGELRKLSTGTAIPHLPAERFRRLSVPVVSNETQVAIAARLSRVRRVAAAARRSRETVVAQARAVLNAALDGAENV